MTLNSDGEASVLELLENVKNNFISITLMFILTWSVNTW